MNKYNIGDIFVPKNTITWDRDCSWTIKLITKNTIYFKFNSKTNTNENCPWLIESVEEKLTKLTKIYNILCR